MKKKIIVPKFKNEDEERAFWSKIDLSKHLEKEDFETVLFSNLKPSSRPVSLRIPEYLINRVKEKAHALNVPYQSLMKQYISEGVLG